jgi:hypothetical protein
VGFLFGFSLAASFAAYHLLEEYKRASAALQTSIDELRIGTEKVRVVIDIQCTTFLHALQVSAHVRRIEAVEKDLKALSEASSTKDDISRVRTEMKKLYDGLHVGEFTNILRFQCVSLQILLIRIFGPAIACLGDPYVFLLHWRAQY